MAGSDKLDSEYKPKVRLRVTYCDIINTPPHKFGASQSGTVLKICLPMQKTEESTSSIPE